MIKHFEVVRACQGIRVGNGLLQFHRYCPLWIETDCYGDIVNVNETTIQLDDGRNLTIEILDTFYIKERSPRITYKFWKNLAKKHPNKLRILKLEPGVDMAEYVKMIRHAFVHQGVMIGDDLLQFYKYTPSWFERNIQGFTNIVNEVDIELDDGSELRIEVISTFSIRKNSPRRTYKFWKDLAKKNPDKVQILKYKKNTTIIG